MNKANQGALFLGVEGKEDSLVDAYSTAVML